MVRIQGIKIGITVMAFVVALLTVNTLSAAAGLSIGMSTSGLPSADQVEKTAGEFKEPEVTGVGAEDPGFFGLITGVTDTLQQLVALTTNLQGILGAYGVPTVIGYSGQLLVDVTMGLGILQILLRFLL